MFRQYGTKYSCPSGNTYVMAIYRPSETKAWLKCPVARSLEYLDGWRPRVLGRRNLAALLGTGIHAGVAVYHMALKEGATPDVAAAQAHALVVLKTELEKLTTLGCVIRPEEQPYADSLQRRVEQGVARYVASDPITKQSWQVRHVEQRLENFGGCTIDLGVSTALGLAIVDVKTRLTLDDRYRQKTRAEYGTDWQLRHYVWSYAQYMGQPVQDYFIILVTLEPFSVEVWPYNITEEDMKTWECSSNIAWSLMEDLRSMPNMTWQNLTSCHTSFGPCDYLKACHTYHYDEALMRRDYVKEGLR